eukprot:12362390-Prorocentrum_lima.AAC.1
MVVQKPRVEARGRVKEKARASHRSLVHLLLKGMRNMMKNKNTENQNGMVTKKPTIPQHKKGMQGMRHGIGSKMARKVTMRKKKHME